MPTFPTIKQGSSGGYVKNLQITMNTWANQLGREDFFVGATDGQFGSKTAQAVRNLQYALGLQPDGIVGPLTWDAIQKTGEAILSGKTPLLRPPRASTGTAPGPSPTPGTKIPTPPGGFDLASLFGSLDWKLVGMAVALGIGALYYLGKRGK